MQAAITTSGVFKANNYLFFTKLIADILAEKIPLRQPRSNPRVLKKLRSKFSAKKPMLRQTAPKIKPLVFSITNSA